MKCIICNSELRQSKSPKYLVCPNHHIFFLKEAMSNNLSLDDVKIDFIKSKDGEPDAVFAKAMAKFNNNRRCVCGIKLIRGKYSLLFGAEFEVYIKKIK